MKVKALLATTALAAVVSTAAFADGMDVKMAGRVKFQYGNASQSAAYKDANKALGNTNSSFNNNAAVTVNAEGKNDTLTYGANVRLNTVAQSTNMSKATKKARTYMYLESNFGRVELGSNYSVARLMRVSSADIARAAGGAPDGDWMDYVAVPSIDSDEDFRTNNYNMLSSFESAESARKISWMSPNYNGVQFGLSYAPDARNQGDTARAYGMLSNVGGNKVAFKNVYSAALNYTNNMDNMNVALSAVYEGGSVNKNAIKAVKDSGVITAVDWANSEMKALRSYSLGMVLGTNNGFSVAAGYLNEGKSGKFTKLNSDAAKSGNGVTYDFGVAYANGAVGVSLTYLNAKTPMETGVADVKEYAKTTAYNLGADYQVAPGLMAYADVTKFKMKYAANIADPTGAKTNKGTVVLLGMELGF